MARTDVIPQRAVMTSVRWMEGRGKWGPDQLLTSCLSEVRRVNILMEALGMFYMVSYLIEIVNGNSLN